MTGGDPFLGEEFLSFWEEWDAQGQARLHAHDLTKAPGDAGRPAHR